MNMTLNRFTEMANRLKGTKQTAFSVTNSSPGSIELMAWCSQEEPVQYEQFFLQLENDGMTKTDSKRTKEIVQQQKEAQKRKEKQDEFKGHNVRNYHSDAPVPEEYRYPASSFPEDEKELPFTPGLFITARLLDTRSSLEMVRLTWKRDGNWKHEIFPRKIIARTSDISNLADYGVPVTSVNASAVVQYLSGLETINADLIPKVKYTNKLGWTPDMSQFMWGKRPITSSFIAGKAMELEDILKLIEGNDEKLVYHPQSIGEEQVADGLFSQGDYEKWVTAANDLFQYPSVITALYASLLPPFLKIIGCDNFTLDLACETSTGKTSTLKIAASCWGNPDVREDSFARTWHQTSNAVEGAASIMSDLPFIVDDTKQAEISMKPRDAHAMISSVLYMISSGRGKGRAQVDGMRATGTFNTVMLTSGELPSVDMSKAGGAIARVLTLSGKPFGAVDEQTRQVVERIDAIVSENFGYAGPQVVQFILQHRDDWNLWKQAFNEAREQIALLSVDSHIEGRVSKYVAALVTVIPIIHAALPELNRDIRINDILSAVWTNVQASISRADRPSEAARVAYEWACNNSNRFWERCKDTSGNLLVPMDEIVGHWFLKNWEFIGFTRKTLKSILINEGFDFKQILNDWDNRGWLVHTPSMKGQQLKVSFGQNKKNVYALSRSGINQALLQTGLESTLG